MAATLRISLLGKSETAAVLLRLVERDAKNAKKAAYRSKNKEHCRQVREAWAEANPDRLKQYKQGMLGRSRIAAPAAFAVSQRAAARADAKAKNVALFGSEIAYQRAKWVRGHFTGSLARKYGISVEDYARLEHAQDRKCAGCLKDLNSGKRSAHVDHDHITGAVRGLLCVRCNLSVGTAKESPSTLRRLAEYIEKHSENKELHRAR